MKRPVSTSTPPILKPKLATCALALLIAAAALISCHVDTPVSVDVDLGLEELRVTTETSGPRSDENSYRLEISGPSTLIDDALDANDSKAYPLLNDGRYRVELSDVAPHCLAERPVREIDLHVGSHRTVVFRIGCSSAG